MKFRDYLSNEFETGEDQYLPTLKTRYYRCRNDDAKSAVLKLIEIEKGKVKAIVEEHHEIFFQTPSYTATITIISPRIGETAIDIKITTYKLIAMGFGKKIIERIYNYLDTQLPYKGVSLYKGY